ncbi:hypothetical protein [Amylibacter sp. IMCC11727]|nr:hypothetical protein [Amylibacter sp. IMCC11727]WGI22194.1 hypothetical protein QBD29_01895 [Amylibacter sp. IMCC11727]
MNMNKNERPRSIPDRIFKGVIFTAAVCTIFATVYGVIYVG